MESPVESLEDVFQTLKHIAQGNSTVTVFTALLADNTDPFLHSPSHIEIRKFSCKTKGREKYVRRVYANFEIMKKYRCVGWVFDSDLENCMICGASFGLFKRKHHCRTCGDLVCTDCSEGEVIITEYPEYGYVKACNNCYFGQVFAAYIIIGGGGNLCFSCRNVFLCSRNPWTIKLYPSETCRYQLWPLNMWLPVYRPESCQVSNNGYTTKRLRLPDFVKKLLHTHPLHH